MVKNEPQCYQGLMLIENALYQQIKQVMPVPCVDLLVSDHQGQTLLVKRKNEPALGQWWFPGGRVHFKETRSQAAIRKLREECGIEAWKTTELGTYDVLLNLSGGQISHGITTLFLMQVDHPFSVKLDLSSSAAEWRPVSDWKKESLHPFVREGLERFR